MPDKPTNEALDYKMPFGKYNGRTLWEIATGSDGIEEDPLYLDWGAGELDRQAGDMMRAAVEIPEIDKMIDRALDAKDHKYGRGCE